MMKEYNHLKIEQKWQKEWEKKKIYQTLSSSAAKTKKMKPYYVLDMFPYPSGAGLHVGHPRGYIASDAFSRYKRMQGYNVLHPMGFDSFGLPAEQYAIQTGKHPGPFTDKLIERYREQLSVIGFSYDWSREVATHHPEYYKFTQWIFLQIYNSYYNLKTDKAEPIEKLVKEFAKNGNTKVSAVCDANTPTFTAKEWKSYSEIEKQNILMKYRLAYEGYAEVNWCAELGTVLANDEIVDGPNGPVSERGGHPVVKKKMRQWFMRITAYADRLRAGLDTIDWSTHIKEIQRNWIGKSEGSEITFEIRFAHGQKPGAIPVFTTRADTLFGATYMVLSPEHVWVTLAVDDNHIGVLDNCDEVKKYIAEVKQKTEVERTSNDKEKTGIELKGVKAINPANGEEIPVWIADYVLAGYGTGAVMAVPAHDERDFEFAKKYNLPIKQVIEPVIGIPKDHEVYRRGVNCVVFNPKNQKYGVAVWNHGQKTFFGGGIDDGEDAQTSAIRETEEESGFVHFEKIYDLGTARIHFRNVAKNLNRIADITNFLFILKDDNLGTLNKQSHEQFETGWFDAKDLLTEWESDTTGLGVMHSAYFLKQAVAQAIQGKFDLTTTKIPNVPFNSDDGILTNSGKFCGMKSDEARAKITDFVGGKIVTKYKMRDAIFARQRYWGEPIPLVHKKLEPKLEIEFSGEFRYKLLKEGQKTIEVRALDKKERKQVKIGDILKFTHTNKKENFLVKVTDLWNFKNVSDIFKNGKHIFKDAYPDEKIYSLEDLYNRYKKVAPNYDKRIDKFGAVAWRVEKISDQESITAVSLNKLPLKLPNVKSYTPSGTGESPLAGVKDWVKAGYETNTMPGWAGSSWYFLRYIDSKNKKEFASGKELDYWFGKNGGVDMYVGGSEHATGHLLYSRFWHKVLKDLGYLKTEEPFKALRNQGLIMAHDGRKMSKRWGNVVNPDDIVKTYGADTLRLYEMFIGPFDQTVAWSTEAIIGPRKFLERIWRLSQRLASSDSRLANTESGLPEARNQKPEAHIQKIIHRTVKKVTEDIEAMNFNTAVSSMMICLNEMERAQAISISDFKMFLQILAPFAPHMAEELWQMLSAPQGRTLGSLKDRPFPAESIHLSLWPKYNVQKIIDDEVTIGIQINGKVRAEITIAVDADEESVKSAALAHEKILPWITGKEIRKVIYVKGRLVNIVV